MKNLNFSYEPKLKVTEDVVADIACLVFFNKNLVGAHSLRAGGAMGL